MPLPPYPALPQPRTWLPGDQILAPRLRADLANAAILAAYRPVYSGAQTTLAQALTAATASPVGLDTDYLDGWQGHAAPAAAYVPRLPGWYLAEGCSEAGHVPGTGTYQTGITALQAGVTASVAGGTVPGNGVSNQGTQAAALVQMDPATGDTVSLFAKPSAACSIALATLKAEWAAFPSTLPQYGSPSVITSPPAASPWPSGAGTVITTPGGVPAGATTMQVADPTGIVTGGTLGLDYLGGEAVSPLAETVQITSVAGTTIGITPPAWPHGGAASPGIVAVPVSSAFLNQQSLDLIQFLAYPPIASLHYGSGSPALGSQVFPAGTAAPLSSADVDNFLRFNGTDRYTFPVSGVYTAYGQAAFAAAANCNLAAGLAISGGPVQWGTTPANSSATALAMTATVRADVRVTAGQYVQLVASQNSGGALAWAAGAGASRLIVVFRSF